MPSTSAEAKWLDANTLWLGVPHRTQLDNSIYAQSNCGPSSLAMVLEAYGLTGYLTDALRGEVNRLMGNSDPGSGTALPDLATVAERAGLQPVGLYGRPGVYKRWTVEELREQLKAGRPLITLARYADLPGNGYFDGNINHYIVLSGLSGDNFIYNDTAYVQGRGQGLMISVEALQRAWANSVIPGQAVAFARNADGDGLLSRNLAPAEREAEAFDAGSHGFELEEPPTIAQDMLPGHELNAASVGAAEMQERAVAVVTSRGAFIAPPSRPPPFAAEAARNGDTPSAAVFTAVILLVYAGGSVMFGRTRAQRPFVPDR